MNRQPLAVDLVKDPRACGPVDMLDRPVVRRLCELDGLQVRRTPKSYNSSFVPTDQLGPAQIKSCFRFLRRVLAQA